MTEKDENKDFVEDLNGDNKELKQKQNKQLKWIIGLMILLILLILIVPFSTNYVIKNYINKFEFIKLEFEKTRMGEMDTYTSFVPVVDNKREIVDQYQVIFRNDPRELQNEIDPKIMESIGLKFITSKPVYISIDPGMNACADNSVALFTLGGFLADSGLNVKSAVTNPEYAKLNNLTYKTCNDSSSNTVIIVNSGNETKIKQTRTNCFVITYSNCDILKVVERFNLAILEDYMSYFKKKSEIEAGKVLENQEKNGVLQNISNSS